MYENISLAQILATLDDVSIQLKNAAGYDAFISQPDLDQLLLPIYASDIERAYLLGALFAIAGITEPTAGGRITKNDIDRATQIIIEKVIPQYRLVPGTLSVAAEADLFLRGVDYIQVAGRLKDYVNKRHALAAQILVEELRPLVLNLYFNSFHQQDTGIYVDAIPFPYTRVSGASFLEALALSGNQQWQDANQLFGQEIEHGATIEDFWDAFPGLQNEGADRERALQVERLWKMHFCQARYLRFDNSAYDTTHFVVTGVNGSGELVFMWLRYLWG